MTSQLRRTDLDACDACATPRASARASFAIGTTAVAGHEQRDVAAFEFRHHRR
jgi:hypothetical protein